MVRFKAKNFWKSGSTIRIRVTKKNALIFILVSIILVISSIMLVSHLKKETVFIDNGNEEIELRVWLADSEQKMQRGLMGRKHLSENDGMFFAFGEENFYSFWMKNTLIPLDILFISQDFTIVDIIYAEPCEEDPCEHFQPKTQAKYVLEVNGNFTAKNDINIGDKLIMDKEIIDKMMKKIARG